MTRHSIPRQIINRLAVGLLCFAGSLLHTQCSKKENTANSQPKSEVGEYGKIPDNTVWLRGQTMKMTPEGAIEMIINQTSEKSPGYPNGTLLLLHPKGQKTPSPEFLEIFKKEIQFRNIHIRIDLVEGSPKTVDGDLWLPKSDPSTDVPVNRKK